MGNRKPSFKLNESGSRYIGFSGFVHLWLRHTQMNPGTMINAEEVDQFTDLSLRRYRVKAFGMLTDKFYFAFQIGNNNVNFKNAISNSVKVLDANAEYRFSKAFHLGGGKSAWMGLSRYSAPSTSKMLTYDMVLVAIPTVNRDDDLLRLFSIYAKGQIKKFDYRLVYGNVQAAASPIIKENISSYAFNKPGTVSTAYLKYMFFDSETNAHNFHAGTYHGSKKMLNLGVGFKHVNDNMWHTNTAGDTIVTDELLLSADFFYEQPINKTKNTVYTLYAAYFNYDFGPNFIRNVGINQPGTSSNDPSVFNGFGNSYPVVGTGEAVYLQTAFLAPKMGQEGRSGQLQPYVNVLLADWEALDDQMLMYDIGFNWLLNKHLSKFSFNYQSRPIFTRTTDGIKATDRKGMFVLQYQFRIE